MQDRVHALESVLQVAGNEMQILITDQESQATALVSAVQRTSSSEVSALSTRVGGQLPQVVNRKGCSMHHEVSGDGAWGGCHEYQKEAQCLRERVQDMKEVVKRVLMAAEAAAESEAWKLQSDLKRSAAAQPLQIDLASASAALTAQVAAHEPAAQECETNAGTEVPALEHFHSRSPPPIMRVGPLLDTSAASDERPSHQMPFLPSPEASDPSDLFNSHSHAALHIELPSDNQSPPLPLIPTTPLPVSALAASPVATPRTSRLASPSPPAQHHASPLLTTSSPNSAIPSIPSPQVLRPALAQPSLLVDLQRKLSVALRKATEASEELQTTQTMLHAKETANAELLEALKASREDIVQLRRCMTSTAAPETAESPPESATYHKLQNEVASVHRCPHDSLLPSFPASVPVQAGAASGFERLHHKTPAAAAHACTADQGATSAKTREGSMEIATLQAVQHLHASSVSGLVAAGDTGPAPACTGGPPAETLHGPAEAVPSTATSTPLHGSSTGSGASGYSPENVAAGISGSPKSCGWAASEHLAQHCMWDATTQSELQGLEPAHGRVELVTYKEETAQLRTSLAVAQADGLLWQQAIFTLRAEHDGQDKSLQEAQQEMAALQTSLVAAGMDCAALKQAAIVSHKEAQHAKNELLELQVELRGVMQAHVRLKATCSKVEVDAEAARRGVQRMQDDVSALTNRLAGSQEKQDALQSVRFLRLPCPF
jgi:hypothetical protein